MRLSIAAFIVFVATSPAPAADTSPVDAAYKQAKAACVEILVEGHLAGSGWFTDKSGLILTAGHVLERPGLRVEINSPSLGRLNAQTLAVDLGHDLALLKVDLGSRESPVLRFADHLPPVGADVWCFGAPLYRHAVLAPGKVAADAPAFEYYENRYVEILHFAATIPAGMSGGPWLNDHGEVIGCQSGVMSQGGVPIGVSFVAPLGAARQLVERRQSAATPTLGTALEELWQQDGKLLSRYPPATEGLLAVRLQDDGPAARGGIKKEDLIIAADGKKIRQLDDIQRHILQKRPGDGVELTVLNPDGAGDRKITVKLGSLETAWPKAAGQTGPKAAEKTTP